MLCVCACVGGGAFSISFQKDFTLLMTLGFIKFIARTYSLFRMCSFADIYFNSNGLLFNFNLFMNVCS